jgi:DNA invertase Pin-like site-specific DNA recombinase
MTRNIAYRRVSTTHLNQKVQRQLFNTGLDFAHEFEDKQSGKSALKRTQFLEMLKVVEKGDIIHIQSNDRVFRNTKELLGFVENMVNTGITVKFHTENLTLGSATNSPMEMAMSKLVLTNMGAISEFFLANNSCAVKQGMLCAKEKGSKFGRASPLYGTKTGNGTERIDKFIAEKKQEALDKTLYIIPEVKKALKYLGKRPTQSKVATLLNDMKVPTPTGKGVWSQSKLQRVLDRHNVNIFNIGG